MRPELGFAGTKRVVKVKGHGKGRRGRIVETDMPSGTWMVLFEDTRLIERANPYEFEYEEAVGRYACR